MNPNQQGRNWNGDSLVYELKGRGVSSRRLLAPDPGRSTRDQRERGRRDETPRKKVGEGIHVRQQESASWYTPGGVAKKRRQIEAKGLPNMKGRRFLTLTIDQVLFGHCPLTAYLEGKDYMRRFLEAGRKAGLWDRGCWWAWKLEFQANGWPHWHLLMDRTKKFTVAEMRKIEKLWWLGGTNCRRIAKRKFGYQFKYAFKGVFQEGDESGRCVPDWFLDYYEPSKTGRASSFGRVRFWQTSKGFYTGTPPKVDEAKEPQSSILPRPAREILDERKRRVIVCSRGRNGEYDKSKSLSLGVEFKDFLRLFLWDVDHSAGVVLSGRSFVVEPRTLKRTINQNQLWQLQQIQQRNRLTLRAADRIRHQRRSLETC